MLGRSATRIGMLAISIDLDPSSRGAAGSTPALSRLLRICKQYRTPATWTVGDPARSSAAQQKILHLSSCLEGSFLMGNYSITIFGRIDSSAS